MKTFLLSLLTACACLGQESFTLNSVVPGEQPAEVTGGAASTLNDGLISYWKLDETSGTRADSETTDTAQDLTDVNTVTSAAGKIGNAAQFVAANAEYLSRADSADLSGGDTDFTLAAWVKLPQNTSTIEIINKYSPAEYNLTFIANAYFRWYVNDGTTTTSLNATNFGLPSTDTWYLLIAWHDSVNNQIGICVNAGTPNTASWTTGVRDGASAFGIGRGVALAYFGGLIDEVGFWRKVLSSDERTELYNGGAGKTYPF